MLTTDSDNRDFETASDSCDVCGRPDTSTTGGRSLCSCHLRDYHHGVARFPTG